MAKAQQHQPVNPPTSPTSPIAPYPPLPTPEYRSRAPEFYGFVAWTTTSLLFVIFLLWALLPDAWIVRLGVEWYPSREWAILLPAYTTFLILLTYFVYFALAIADTPSFSDTSTLTDLKHQLSLPYDDDYYHRSPTGPNPDINSEPILEPHDIPIALVNRVLYNRPRPPPT